MRARNIKPGFFTDIDLAEKCCRDARLLFAGLWCLADCEGRMEDNARWICGEIFRWDDDVTPLTVDELLAQLADGRFIVRYEVGEKRYIQVTNFVEHQNPHPKEKARGSSIPAPGSLPVADGNGKSTASKLPVADGNCPVAESPLPVTENPRPVSYRQLSGRADVLIPDVLIPDVPRKSSATPLPLLRDTALDFDGKDPLEWYQGIFAGEWMPDTWRSFPQYVNTPDLLAKFRSNTPLWMKTKKYRDGFGKDSINFLKSKVWHEEPRPELYGKDGRNGIGLVPPEDPYGPEPFRRNW